MDQHFISTAGTIKNGINQTSDHQSIILPLYKVQPLHFICSYSPCFILQSYWSIILVVLLYVNISNDSPYIRCPDEERFYLFEILAFGTLKLQIICAAVFAFNKFCLINPIWIGGGGGGCFPEGFAEYL